MRCRVDPQGEFAYATAEDRSVQRWNLSTGEITTLGTHDGWIWGLIVVDDGATVITGGTDGRLHWWPTREKPSRPVRTIVAHEGWVRYIDASPDGKVIASVGNDHRVRLWETATGRQVRELEGHDAHVYSTFFHPGQSTLWSGDLLGKVKQWDLDSGREVSELVGEALHTYNGGQRVHYGGIRSIALSPDGKHLALSGLHKASNPLGAVSEPWSSSSNGRRASSSVRAPTECVARHGARCFIRRERSWHPSGEAAAGFLLFWKAGEDKAFPSIQASEHGAGLRPAPGRPASDHRPPRSAPSGHAARGRREANGREAGRSQAGREELISRRRLSDAAATADDGECLRRPWIGGGTTDWIRWVSAGF